MDGLKTSKSHLWDDAELKAEFQASLMKDIDSIIITPGAGDKPLMMHSEIGKTVGQFKSFMFASGNRATIAGFQQNDFAAYSGMSVMIGLGSLAYAIKSKVAGREVDTSPERLIREGFDRSGLLSVIGEINGITEGISRGNLGLHVLSGGKPLSRYQQRNMMGNLLGPSFGKGQDIFNVAGAVSTGEFNKGSVNSAKRMIPFQNLFYLQGLISAVDKK